MTAPAATAPSAFKSVQGQARFLEAYDSVLREWPVPFVEMDVATPVGTTHLIASGSPDAPPLLLLPSMAASATLWRPNVEALSRFYRTYAVDVVGQVGKSVAVRRLRSRQDFAEWLDALLDGLEQERASLVGASYGGFLALNQAIFSPERVERVVLISPAGTFVGGLGKLLLRALFSRLVRGKAPRQITDLLGKGVRLDPADEAWGALMAVTMVESSRPNLVPPIVFGREELASVRAPVLLLIGERERLYDPVRTLKIARERLPGLRGEVVPSAHHLAALARPELVNRLMLEFLMQGRSPAIES